MIKELYSVITNETSLSVTSGRIDSIRRKNITKSACRVYDGEYIGIAGTLGEPTEQTWKEAEENLSRKIPYKYSPANGGKIHCDNSVSMTVEEFIEKSERLLEALTSEFPQFVFSNKINFIDRTQILRNDAGADYFHRGSAVALSLVIREEGSSSIFDTALSSLDREYDIEKILREARSVLSAHSKPVELPANDIPVIFDMETITGLLAYPLNGQVLHRGASLLSGKIGEKIFSDDFSLYVDRSSDCPLVPFFDTEGSTLDDKRKELINNGKLIRACADKKTADEFNTDCTASADGAYDDVPKISPDCFDIKSTAKLHDIVGDGYAVFAVMASGGDMTPDGNFATPVQTSYLYKNGELIGKLPELSVSGSIFDLLGKDYLGCSIDKPYYSSKFIVMNMKIS